MSIAPGPRARLPPDENVLHAVNALLAFVLFPRWTNRPGRAFFAAAVWAWHPLRVESVAWVSARKDVLSGLFFLLCLLAYDFARREPPAGRPPRPGRRRAGLACILVALTAGLSVKPLLVTVPAVLLLLDAWPLRRLPMVGSGFWRTLPRLVAEKALFWLLVAAAAGLAVIAHAHTSSLGGLPLSSRLLTLPLHYAFYLFKTVFPARLTVLYPHLSVHPADWLAAAGLLLALSVWAWRSRRTAPALLIGWLWFLGVLLPASGIVPPRRTPCSSRAARWRPWNWPTAPAPPGGATDAHDFLRASILASQGRAADARDALLAPEAARLAIDNGLEALPRHGWNTSLEGFSSAHPPRPGAAAATFRTRCGIRTGWDSVIAVRMNEMPPPPATGPAARRRSAAGPPRPDDLLPYYSASGSASSGGRPCILPRPSRTPPRRYRNAEQPRLAHGHVRMVPRAPG